MPKNLILVVGRLTYAFATGLALLGALSDSTHASTVGTYTYQAGLGTAAAIILGLGVDRLVARRVAAGELPQAIPQSALLLRGLEALTVMAASAAASAVFGNAELILSTATFVVSRLIYNDVEAYWIAARCGDVTLGISLVANGLVTAAGVYFGAEISAPAMTLASAAGNAVGLLVLLAGSRVHVKSVAMPDAVPEARGFALSATLGVVYARVDLVILAVVGVSLETVAIYGVVTRAYDAMALIRGALAQQETRDIAALDVRRRMDRLAMIARRASMLSGVVAVAGLASLALVRSTGVTLEPTDVWTILAFGIAGLPLFFSHLPTSAMVFADRRTHLLLVGSIAACAASIATKGVLIAAYGTVGAVAAIGLVEYVSCLVFVALYWRPLRSREALVVVGFPLAAFGIAGLSLIGIRQSEEWA